MKVHYSSETDLWATPQAFYDQLHAEFGFTLDVCALTENAKCPRYITPCEDGLLQDWTQDICWMNPPYGRVIGQWMRKAYESAQAGAIVVCLVPARTDTRWWHDYAMRGEIRFIKGRLKFGDAKASAPFPNAVVVFRPPVAMEKGCMTAFNSIDERERDRRDIAELLEIADEALSEFLCYAQDEGPDSAERRAREARARYEALIARRAAEDAGKALP